MSSILTDIDLDTTMLLLPEILMLLGIVAMILIPNLGDATMRIPLTRTRVPIFIGGTRSEFSNNPKLPNTIASGVLGLALLTSFLYLERKPMSGMLCTSMSLADYSPYYSPRHYYSRL